MTDIFQEVEEDVRRERYEQLWKNYGHFIIGAAALLVVGVAAFQLWKTYDQNQRQSASDRFQMAQQLAATGNAPKAEESFVALSTDAPSGYELLSKFRVASAQLAQGKRAPAIAGLRELTTASDTQLAAAARIRLAWALADEAPRAEVTSLLAPLTAAENPWHGAAGEVLAYLEYKNGTRQAAQAAYEKLAQDAAASAGLRQRSAAIAAYLKANPTATVAPAAPAPAPQETAPK